MMTPIRIPRDTLPRWTLGVLLLLLGGDPARVPAQPPGDLRSQAELCSDKDEPILLHFSPSAQQEQSAPTRQPGGPTADDPAQGLRYGLKIDEQRPLEQGFLSYKATPHYVDSAQDPPVRPFMFEPARAGQALPLHGFISAPASQTTQTELTFDLVLYKLRLTPPYLWVNAQPGSDLGCLKHILFGGADLNALKDTTDNPVQSSRLQLTPVPQEMLDNPQLAALFPHRQAPFWIVHAEPLPRDLFAEKRPTTSARTSDMDDIPPPELPPPGRPITADPTEAPTEPPKVIRQDPPGGSSAETTSAPSTQVFSVEIVEARKASPEEQESDSSLPDFALLLPSLRERLCLTLDGQTPLHIDWNATQVRFDPSKRSELRVGTLALQPADTRGEPLQTKASTSQCIVGPTDGKRSTYFEVLPQPDLPAQAEDAQTLRLKVRLNRIRHRASVLEMLDGKSAPATAPQTFTWQASNGSDTSPVSTAPHADLIQGSPLSYSLTPQDDPKYADSKEPLKVEPGKGKACAESSAANTGSGCFQVEVARTLKTSPLTLVAQEKTRSCAIKPLPKKVRIHAQNASELWPKSRALELTLAKKEDVPTAWYPLKASLLKADAGAWTLEPWTLDAANQSSPLLFTAQMEQTPVPVIRSGVEAAQAGSFTLEFKDLCGQSYKRTLAPGDSQLKLSLPEGFEVKKAAAWLKKQTPAPELVLTPPRGFRLKGCSSVSPTCTSPLDSVLGDKGLTLELEAAPSVHLLYVFLSKQLTDPEALHTLLKSRLETLRKDEPEATVRLVVTDGRSLSVATDDPKALDNTLQNVLEWTPRGIAPQSLERLDQALEGLSEIRKDWLELKLELYIAAPLWDDIGRETEWISTLVKTHRLESAQAGILDLKPAKPPRPYAKLLTLKPLTQP